MPKLNLLHHKSYHPYKAENIEKVRADEANALALQQEDDRRSTLADSEARLVRLKVKSRKASGKLPDEAEVRLEASLARKSSTTNLNSILNAQVGGIASGPGVGGVASGSRITREEKKEIQSGGMTEEAHINFWKDFEAGTSETTHKSTQQKAREAKKAEEDSLTKVFLGKIGEGDVRGWYGAEDGMTVRERKEGVEGGLERAYKDGESKRLSDPLALMNSYLLRRTEIKSSTLSSPPFHPSTHSQSSSTNGNNGRARGNYGNGRSFYPLPSTAGDMSGGGSGEVTTSILAPRRRRGEIPLALRSSLPAPSSSLNPASHPPLLPPTTRPLPLSTPTIDPPPPTQPTSTSKSNAETEAASRQSTESARARTLIASKKAAARRLLSSTSSNPSTPTSSVYSHFDDDSSRGAQGDGGGKGRGSGRRDGAGEDQYNSKETFEAGLHRSGQTKFGSYPSPSLPTSSTHLPSTSSRQRDDYRNLPSGSSRRQEDDASSRRYEDHGSSRRDDYRAADRRKDGGRHEGGEGKERERETSDWVRMRRERDSRGR